MNINRKVLLKEVQSVEKGKNERGEAVDYTLLYSAINTENDRGKLAIALLEHKLGYFAQKLINGMYEK